MFTILKSVSKYINDMIFGNDIRNEIIEKINDAKNNISEEAKQELLSSIMINNPEKFLEQINNNKNNILEETKIDLMKSIFKNNPENINDIIKDCNKNLMDNADDIKKIDKQNKITRKIDVHKKYVKWSQTINKKQCGNNNMRKNIIKNEMKWNQHY